MITYAGVHKAMNLLSSSFDESEVNRWSRSVARAYLQDTIRLFEKFISHDPNSRPAQFSRDFIEHMKSVIENSIIDERSHE